jgi:murein DD-endopeptidase MepM/ murein hydrolase activator NlpD
MFRGAKDQLGGFILLSILGLLMFGLIFMDQQFSATKNQQPEDQQQTEDYKEGRNDGDPHQEETEGDIEGSTEDNTKNTVGNENDKTPGIGDLYQLHIQQFEEDSWIQLEELISKTDGSYEIDVTNGVIHMELFGIPFVWVKDVPVVERNGLYLPYQIKPLFKDEQVFIPLDFLTYGLDLELDVAQDLQQVTFRVNPEAEDVFAELSTRPIQLENLTVDEVIDYLSFLTSPVTEASISTRESHLPGARRAYRNGYHEGIDWYSGTSGRKIDLNTPVISVADGIVVRVDHDYVEMEREEREGFLTRSSHLNSTPTFILDNLRGRSVWVQYDQGVMVRYVHLSRVEESIAVGQKVKRGDTLGYVGNSGTSFAIDGDKHGGLHLHADLLIYGELFWEYIDQPDQVRHVLEMVFHE